MNNEMNLITVDVGDLKKEEKALAKFLQSKLQVPIRMNDKALIIDDTKTLKKARAVKMYVKAFLHKRGLSEEYRVTAHRQLVRVLKVKTHKRSKARKEEGRVPHPTETMPWYYPWRT